MPLPSGSRDETDRSRGKLLLSSSWHGRARRENQTRQDVLRRESCAGSRPVAPALSEPLLSTCSTTSNCRSGSWEEDSCPTLSRFWRRIRAHSRWKSGLWLPASTRASTVLKVAQPAPMPTSATLTSKPSLRASRCVTTAVTSASRPAAFSAGKRSSSPSSRAWLFRPVSKLVGDPAMSVSGTRSITSTAASAPRSVDDANRRALTL
jgi:hypothetical protein